MQDEILKSPAAARNAMETISKIVSQFEWPSRDKKIEWTKTYEELITKNKIDCEITIPDSEYKRLHKLLEKYFSEKNFSAISLFKRNLKMICYALDSTLLYNPPLTDSLNEEKLFLILNDISKSPQFFETVAFPLLSVYLRNKNGVQILKERLFNIFETFSKSENKSLQSVSVNIKLYLDKNELYEALKNTNKETLKDSLVQCGILEQFCRASNKFFTSMFFYWIISRSDFSIDFITKNLESIKNFCIPDEEKIIQAVFITNIYNKKTLEAFDEIQNILDLMQMRNAETEVFWHLNNQNLEGRFKKYLLNAYSIVRTMITTDFIRFVFNYFGSHSDVDERRIIFWRSYAERVIDFKLFCSESEKRSFYNNVSFLQTKKSKVYADVINTHSIIDNDYSGNIALIFKFEQLIMVEFPRTGKPAQIYQPNNRISKIFEPRRIYASFSDVRQYKDVDGERFNNGNNEGSFAHRGDWEAALQSCLEQFDLYRGN